jgi:hypothetical protein
LARASATYSCIQQATYNGDEHWGHCTDTLSSTWQSMGVVGHQVPESQCHAGNHQCTRNTQEFFIPMRTHVLTSGMQLLLCVACRDLTCDAFSMNLGLLSCLLMPSKSWRKGASGSG